MVLLYEERKAGRRKAIQGNVNAQRLLAGASGFSFKEWKGVFYPDDMRPYGMLSWYAARLPTVEINNTFYRMPKAQVLENWGASTPDDFRFAIKASRRLTHVAKLRPEASAEPLAILYRALAALGTKRGPVLFQLPPSFKKDLPVLTAFLQLLPKEHRAAFEFRNEAWYSEDVYDALKGHGAALCVSEREDGEVPRLVQTAPTGYVRLRLERYSDERLQRWAATLKTTRWGDIFAYFMHEPTAPDYAARLMRFFEA